LPCYRNSVPPRFQHPPKPLPYNFLLEIDGAVCARFQEVSGLDLPHGTTRTTIILKRGIITGPGLWAWRKQGNVPLKNGALVMLGGSGAEKGRWKFQGGRISKWVGPEFQAKGGGDVAMKTLELTCEEIGLA
jgi:T4-like virus tail tube protein gp19